MNQKQAAATVALSEKEKQVLALMRSAEQVPIEYIVERFGGNEVIPIIRRLTLMGHLSVVILGYPWGTEIDVATDQGVKSRLKGAKPNALQTVPYVAIKEQPEEYGTLRD